MITLFIDLAILLTVVVVLELYILWFLRDMSEAMKLTAQLIVQVSPYRKKSTGTASLREAHKAYNRSLQEQFMKEEEP